MVAVSLVFAVFVWLVVLWVGLLSSKSPVAGGIAGLVISGVFCILFALLSPTLFLTGLLMLLAGVVCQWQGIHGTRYAAVTFAMIPLAFVIVGYPAWNRVQQQMEAQKEYPFESLENRLAYEAKYRPVIGTENPTETDQLSNVSSQLAAETINFVNDIDGSVESQNYYRERMLNLLHQSQMEAFANSPGFGVTRGLNSYSEEYLRTEPRPSITPPAAPVIPYAPDTGEDVAATVANDLVQVEQVTRESNAPFDRDQLGELHLASSIDFVNPNGFGLVRSLQEVAGFEPHAFSKLPELYEQKYQSSSPCGGGDSPEANEPEEDWIIVSLQLVSLLKHEKPMVYATKDLPRMDVLTSEDVPTRALNAFEAEALPKVMDGETLIVQESANRIHMLGAVRAGKTCSKCHQVPKLTLLGAFSYELARVQPVPEKPARPAEGPEL